jgi:hypothetical protein
MNGALFSIGHGGRSVSSVIEPLQRLNVPFLIDARSIPYSRYQPAFQHSLERPARRPPGSSDPDRARAARWEAERAGAPLIEKRLDLQDDLFKHALGRC